MVEMDYISHSRLDVFRQCERAFYKRYVARDKAENPTLDYFANYGTNLHYLAENWYKHRGLIPKNILLDWFINGIEDEGVVGFNKIAMPERMKNSYYNSGINYIDRLIHEDTSQTIATEMPFNVHLADGVPPAQGLIDRIDSTSEGLVVVDYKSSKTYPQEKADMLPQVSLYGLAIKELFGEYPIAYRYVFFRVNDEVVTYRTPEQLEMARQEIIDLWQRINQSKWNATYDSWYCNAFCSYNRSCELYKVKHAEEEAEKEARRLERAERKRVREAKKAAKLAQQDGDV